MRARQCGLRGLTPLIDTLTLCAACLKDLQRFLRQDDRNGRPAFFKLAQLHVARTDLVPIVMAYAHNVDLVYNARAPYRGVRHTGRLDG